MRSKLLLIMLFLAIPTAAYADGWILWARTESLLPGTLEKSTNFTPENYIHGFTSLELCKVESGKQANRNYQSTKEMVSHMEGSNMMVGKIGGNAYFARGKEENGAFVNIHYSWVCYPSDFDPRVK